MTRAFSTCAALAAALIIGALAPATARSSKVPEPAGYRLENFRAPVPATLRGATVIDAKRAFELWSAKLAVFIDALPHAPRPEGIPKDAVWREKPRLDIPGSVWLPDTGFGELSQAAQRYFEEGLSKAASGDKTKPLVFYCLADCWMSWNAAKRALSLGYVHVSWFPEGTDGWAADKLPLEERQPEPRD